MQKFPLVALGAYVDTWLMRPRMILKVFKCMALLLINTLVCSSIAPSFSNGWNDLIKPHIEIGSSESRLLLKNCSLVVARGRKAWLTTYSPYRVSCPMTPLVRDANNVSNTDCSFFLFFDRLDVLY